MYFMSTMNTQNNFLQFIFLVLVFVLIIVAAYFATRWLGTVGAKQYQNKNIRIIEGCRVGQNKVIQIVKVGNKYFVLGIGKDEVTCLGEVDEEGLIITDEEIKPLPDFKEILAKVKEKVPTNKNKKE